MVEKWEKEPMTSPGDGLATSRPHHPTTSPPQHPWLLALAVLLVTSLPAHAWDEVIESVMYRNPELPSARMKLVYDEQKKTLWLDALRRPEADYQGMAALTIGLAHRRGEPGLEVAVAPLLEALERPNQHRSVRLAIIRALVELDARNAADALFHLAQSGDRDLRNEIEPVLARWKYEPARDFWLARLAQPGPSGDGLALAAQGLGMLREEKAIPRLLELVHSRHLDAPIRLEAAKALGVIRASGWEPDARRLMATGSEKEETRKDTTFPVVNKLEVSGLGAGEGAIGRLAAASLLRHHQGDEAVRLLQELAGDVEPTVAVLALARVLEINPKLVVADVGRLVINPDFKVRSAAIEVLFREPSIEHIGLLAARLNDPHPDVRVKARKALRELAKRTEYRDAVIKNGETILAGSDWRGQEQLAILLGQLEHKPVAGRLVELLKSDRAGVMVASAWSLRQLAVAETLPGALKHFQSVTNPPPVPGEKGDKPAAPQEAKTSPMPLRPGQPAPPPPRPRVAPAEAVDQQLSQLAQFFGQSRYRPADAALRQVAPRPGAATMPIETRAAAIWALGLIHEGQPVPEIHEVLVQRVSDTGGPMTPPEDVRVRSMSAVSLARMKAKETLPVLRKFYEAKKLTLDPVNNACGWAIEQLTGEKIPPPGTVGVPAEPFRNWLRALEVGN